MRERGQISSLFYLCDGYKRFVSASGSFASAVGSVGRSVSGSMCHSAHHRTATPFLRENGRFTRAVSCKTCPVITEATCERQITREKEGRSDHR